MKQLDPLELSQMDTGRYGYTVPDMPHLFDDVYWPDDDDA